ncbi:MAG TPA: Tudor-knot domain-containing protein, partial [Candidatus Synoicihabitans sp.]|nr:Tudor-knot domain-containing protein [Candidatus Synoicihabitans sp.]
PALEKASAELRGVAYEVRPLPKAETPSPAAASKPAEPPNTAGYKVGNTIEVEWQGKWFRARILEQRGDSYKIHYDGYGSNWDEWVKANRMRRSASRGR